MLIIRHGEAPAGKRCPILIVHDTRIGVGGKL